jgi:hypothetical protein
LSPDLEKFTAVNPARIHLPRHASETSDPNDLERRSVAELRADHTRIIGYAVVFDARSVDLGGFVEVVRPQAVDRSVRASADVLALYNHDAGAVLGRTPRTLSLVKDGRGLAFTLDPANTQAGRDAFELVKRGDVTGASFGFRTLKDSWRQDAGITIRELHDIDIAEISLTAFPAYRETDVTVAQRALQAAAGEIPPLKSVAWLRLQVRVR